ncbi:MAG: cupin domain-containing protein [Candidatus Latescibacteria bacterium]|nr:cupin domain-containing protein [Candidatus Latescibacterota bacterium]
MVYSINWRDTQPKIAHMSAVHWGGLRSVERDSDDERDCLQRLGGFARHALQGRKTSDYHRHENLEQVYYILSGSGEILFDDKRYPTQAGDAIYLPTGIHHQMFNEGEDWLEHHVISMPVKGEGGQFVVRNWRHAAPQGDGAGAVRWRQLGPQGEGEGGHLRGLAFIDRETVQPGGQTVERSEDVEQVYYILENQGVLITDGEQRAITEGDMIHVPVGQSYRIENPHQAWLIYMIMAA